MFKRKHYMTTEAIAHQDGKLFKATCELVKELMTVKGPLINDRLVEKLGINKIISEGFGINFTLGIDDALYPNAWIYPPVFDASSVVWNIDPIHNSKETTRYFIKQMKEDFQGKEFLNGTVDRENAKITGDFSKILAPAYVTRGLLTHPKATPEIVTSIIFHEVGHFFTFFEHLGRQQTFNSALMASAERFFKVDNEKDKLRVVADMGDLVNLTADDKEAIMGSKSKDQVILVIARSYINDRTSSLGSDIYDITLWESLSDQFASRMAPGSHGVEALDLIYSEGGRYQGMLSHVITTMVKVMLFSLMTIITLGLALLLLFVNPARKIYDAPKARMTRIRNDVVAALRVQNMNKDLRAKLLEDLKVCDEIIAKVEDYRGLIEFFYTSILPSGRKEYSQLLFQRELEKLTNNDLIVASAKLNNLSLKLN